MNYQRLLMLIAIFISGIALCLHEDQLRLYRAIEERDTLLVKELLEDDVDPNFSMHSSKKSEQISFFREHFPDLYDQIIPETKRGSTPLWEACARGLTEIVIDLLNHEADPYLGGTRLNSEVIYDHLHLIKENGDPSYEGLAKTIKNIKFPDPDRNDYIPMHIAIRRGYIEVVKALLNHDPQLLEQRSSHGYTPLMIAIASELPKMIELLLANGADVNVKNSYEITPLHLAIAKGNEELIKIILKNMKDNGIAAKDILGGPCRLAVDLNNKTLLGLLLVAYPDLINIQDEKGNTPLHLAAKKDAWLIEMNNGPKGFNVTRNDNFDMINYLRTKGADFDIKNNKGETPKQLISLSTRCKLKMELTDQEEQELAMKMMMRKVNSPITKRVSLTKIKKSTK